MTSSTSPEPQAPPEGPAESVAAAPALAECSPRSLDEFFNRDPLDLSKADRAIIVAELRRLREVWAKAEASGAKRAPKTQAGSPIAVKSLDELFDDPTS